VKFSQSIAKLAQPLTYRRAFRRARRVIHPIPLRPLLAKIDPHRLGALEARSAAVSPDSPSLWRHYSKYLDVRKHLQLNIRRAQDLNLHRLPPQDILDIGCGGGFFLFVAQGLGHRGIGLDVGGIPLFDELVDLLQIDRLEYKVTGLETLPDFGRNFDLITAFATAFHGGREDAWRWGEREWDFFLANLKRLLKPGGRIFFELNAAYQGEYYSPEILHIFLQHGGLLERGNVLFPSKK
jgi:SAM-dependent methyltransferase